MSRILGALTLQAVGVIFNYLFTLLVAMYAGDYVAGKIFWYFNVIIALSMLSLFGGEAWIVTLSREPGANREAIYRLAFKLSLPLLTCSIVVLLAYLTLVEREPFISGFVIVLSLFFYLCNALLASMAEAEGKGRLSVYLRTLSPYVVSAPVVYYLGESGNVTIELVFFALCISCFISFVAVLMANEGLIRRVISYSHSSPRKDKLTNQYKQKQQYFYISFLNYIFVWHPLFVAKPFISFEQLAELNYYMKICNLVGLPLLVVGVFYARKLASTSDLALRWRLYKESCLVASALGFIPFIVIVFFTPLFTFFLSENYQGGSWVTILALAQLIYMFFGAQVAMMIVSGQLKQANKVLVFFTMLSPVLIAISSHQLGVWGVSLVILCVAISRQVANHFLLIRSKGGTG
ncbi:MAG: hypothetical protein MK214_02380 [Thalassotalea sp.]|nr:hypothetical protein [Thalassotalea sp.]